MSPIFSLLVILLVCVVVGVFMSPTDDDTKGEKGQIGNRGDEAIVTGTLTRCPDCEGTVSKRAASCPHCGAPITADQNREDPTTTIITVGVVGFLFLGVFFYASKLDRDASSLQSRSDDVIATATSMSAADEATAHRVKANKLRGAATGMRIGLAIGVLATLGALIAKRGVR